MEKVKILRKFLNFFKIPLDIFLIFLLLPSSIVMLLFRKIGSHKLNLNRSLLKKIGIFPLREHYYEPQFNFDDLKSDLNKKRVLPGVNLEVHKQLRFLKKLNYQNELINLNLNKGSPKFNFKINNNFFEAGDAEIYYQMIRYFKPRNILEIGSGHSTLISLEAINKNKIENKIKTNLICIEPFENLWLQNLKIKIYKKKIEEIDTSKIINLKRNDILFVDSSHIIRPQGDVLKIFLEILQQLASGVIIHVNDIFTPRNYPSSWLKIENRFFNEQYLFESIINNTNRYSILCSLSALKHDKYNQLKKVCPYLKKNSEPSSFYIKVK